MNFKEIKELLALVNKSKITEFKLKEKDFSISIRTKRYTKNSKIAMSMPQGLPVMPQSFAPPAAPVSAKPAQVDAPVKGSDSNESVDENANLIEVKSPIVGTFYRSPSPDNPPFVSVGDIINVGDVICIVEAMKLFNEIESEVSGKVVKVIVEDASPVEYDQVLFLVDPNA